MLSASFIFFWIWAAAMMLAIWAFCVAHRFSRRVRKSAGEALNPNGRRLPRVAVILPIKGVEDDTHVNLEALLSQDYPEYRLIFAVESDDDPVVPVLEKLAAEDSRIEIVIAGLATSRGQKIHNQLAAVSHTCEQDEILVFMDADAKPDGPWLYHLASPLMRTDLGAVTGYRYYVPVTEHTANKIVSVLNAQVAALLGPYRRTLAWGGSMAIRRVDFYRWDLHGLWQHALSDDYVLSYCVKVKAKSKIHFDPNCLVASEANFNWASLFEFATRQYRITKVCAPWIWLAAVGGTLIYLAAFGYTLFNSIYGLFPHTVPRSEHFIQCSMFLCLYICSMLRGELLIRGGMNLIPQHKPAIRTTRLWATLGIPWCYVISMVVLLGSAFGRSIVWRGIAYKMVSRTQTIVYRPRIASTGVAHRASEIASSDR